MLFNSNSSEFLTERQGIWKQNIESICTATYCQESNITVDIPFTEKSFYHLQNTKDTPSQQEFWTVCSFFISYRIARIQAKQISQQRSLLFSSVELALLISGISSSHLRNLNFHWSMFNVRQIILPDGGGAKYHVSKLFGDHSCLSETHGTHESDIVQGLGLSSASVSMKNLIQSYISGGHCPPKPFTCQIHSSTVIQTSDRSFSAALPAQHTAVKNHWMSQILP